MDSEVEYEKTIYENLEKGYQLRLVVNEFRGVQYLHIRKYFLTYNPQVKEQIVNILDIYRIELRTRQAIAAQKQREQNGDSGLDDLIKVS